MNPQVIVVGLDAATMSLIERYVAEGGLPNISRMMKSGGSGLLLSTPNMHSASSWSSIITGRNPGQHGLYVFSDRDFATNEQVIYTGRDRKCESIFGILARAGKTAGMMNVPMTYPAESAAGSFMISGLDAPVFDEKAFSPASLRQEMKRFAGYAPTPPELPKVMAAGDLDAAIDLWVRLTRARTDAAKYLLETYRPDFFMVVYTCTDWVQHYFWKYTDKRHPEYDSNEAARYHGTIRRFYEMMDAHIGELREACGSEANMIIVSDHGMGCHTQGSFHVVEYLQECGLMRLKPAEPQQSQVLSELREGAKQIAKAVLPESMKKAIKGVVNETTAPIAQKNRFYSRVVWDRTIAYTEHGRNVININLKGRNKHGIVDPADYDRVCDEVIAKLKQWRDPDTGLPVVLRVTRREDMYRGEHTAHASDMYVFWNPEVVLQRPVPEAIRQKKFWWNGAHQPHGVVICEGPKIRPASTASNAIVYDVVPTVLQLLGVEQPAGLDGRVLSELLTERAAGVAAGAKLGESAVTVSADLEVSEEDEQEVAEKLRGLGYL